MDNINEILNNALKASSVLKSLKADVKQAVLEKIAEVLVANSDAIISQNQLDLNKMLDTDSKKDRLLLNTDRINALSKSILEIAVLPDPTNQILSSKNLANGLFIQKKTVPLGVVGVIYEARPNVTIDVAALCLRSSNVCILRGGSDAFYTNIVLVDLIRSVLLEFELDKNIVQLLPVDRKHVYELLTADKYVDIIIPRGSQKLIQFVRENAKVPVIETGAGVCHTYVDASANIAMAANIVCNAKVTRPSVCNSLDTIVLDEEILENFLLQLIHLLLPHQVEIFADERSYPILLSAKYPYLQKADAKDFGREFLALKCSLKTVNGLNEALEHISNFSSKHSEAIISTNEENIERFLNEVDAAAVYANASTRFTDGGEFGLGAEIGISTQKLHARGPFALEKLVTEKWFVKGTGQVR